MIVILMTRLAFRRGSGAILAALGIRGVAAPTLMTDRAAEIALGRRVLESLQ